MSPAAPLGAREAVLRILGLLRGLCAQECAGKVGLLRNVGRFLK